MQYVRSDERKLPKNVLKSNLPPHHLEAQQVREKYSDPRSVIGEASIDYSALTYLNAEASLFWLPRLFEYLTASAPRDTYHLEIALFNLAHAEFSNPLIAKADDREIQSVNCFLEWMSSQSGLLVGSACRQADYDRAIELWRVSRSANPLHAAPIGETEPEK